MSGSQVTSRHDRPGTLYHLALIVILAAFFTHALALAFLCDDAFISFRYLDNFVQGKGLVFNDHIRVEGYTNFLWIMLLAVPRAMGGEPWRFAVTASIAAAMVCLYLTIRLALAWGASRPMALAAGLALAVNQSMGAWATSGLETSLFTCLITAAMLCATEGTGPREGRRAWFGAGCCMALAALTRPEGVYLTLVIAAGLFLFRSGGFRRRLMSLALPAVVLYLPYYCWRYYYYGYPLPNTFYAKSAGQAYFSSGARYLLEFAQSYHLLWFLPCAIAAVCLGTPSRRRARRLGAWVAAAYYSYVAWVGGDFMEYRFVIPALPLLTALIVTGCQRCAETWARSSSPAGARLGMGLVLLFILGMAQPAMVNVERGVDSVDMMRGYLLDWVRIGRWLAMYGRPGEWIATRAVGAIPYFCGLPTLDMLGLTEPTIAHADLTERGRIGHEKQISSADLKCRNLTYIFTHPFLRDKPRGAEGRLTAYLSGQGFFDFHTGHNPMELAGTLIRRGAIMIGLPYRVTFAYTSVESPQGDPLHNAADMDRSTVWRSPPLVSEFSYTLDLEHVALVNAVGWFVEEPELEGTLQLSASIDGADWRSVFSSTGPLPVLCPFGELETRMIKVSFTPHRLGAQLIIHDVFLMHSPMYRDAPVLYPIEHSEVMGPEYQVRGTY